MSLLEMIWGASKTASKEYELLRQTQQREDFWQLKYLEAYKELVKANKGLRRLNASLQRQKEHNSKVDELVRWRIQNKVREMIQEAYVETSEQYAGRWFTGKLQQALLEMRTSGIQKTYGWDWDLINEEENR